MPSDTRGTQHDAVRIEASVRSAALAAAKGIPLGEAFLARIVAETSQPGLSIAERVSRASSMAQEFIAAPKPLNVHSATPHELSAQALATALPGARLGATTGMRAQQGSGNTKRDYQSLAGSDPNALQGVTGTSFGGTPFAAAGMNYGTFNYLRSQDRSFTSQNIMNATGDAKALGFGANDRGAMLDHTIIDRYDPKARQTNESLRKYQTDIEGDDELSSLHDQRKHAKTPDARRKIDEAIAKRREKHSKDSGVDGRSNDASVPGNAKAAINRRKTAIEKKAEQGYEARAEARTSHTPPVLAASKKNSDLFKKLTSPK
jgi:hypothetical protein